MAHDRRSFLKRSGAALSAAALSGCAPEARRSEQEPVGRLDGETLRLVAAIVLPTELGEVGRAAAADAFVRWADGYDPVPELNHGYGTSEIRYGPPDPVPAWGAQLEALRLESERRFGVRFDALTAAEREALLRRHVQSAGDERLVDPLDARHVAVALLAHWAGTPAATDLCYRARVSPRTCRGLDGSASEPEAVG